MKTLIVIVVIVVGLGAYYLFSKNSSNLPPVPIYQPSAQNTPATPAPAVSNTPVATVSATATVSIKNFAFSPATLAVKTGTKVTWVNNDSAPHTITSDSGSLLDSPTITPGQSFSFTFTNPGTISYHCNFHPMMKAVVVVEN